MADIMRDSSLEKTSVLENGMDHIDINTEVQDKPGVLENDMKHGDIKIEVQEKVDSKTTDNNRDNGQGKSNDSKFKWSKMSKRQRHVLVMSIVAIFLTRFSYSILAPFYPLEAEKKGMSTTLTAVVFGVFELVIFLSAPVVGTYLTRLGVKRTYISGVVLGGLCNIVFGTLDKVPDGTPFVVTSVLCRTVEAFGFSAFITAGYAIVSSEFGSNVGMAIGIVETGGGVGFIAGPVIGGALYQLGGYGLPFYFIGVIAMINAFLIYKFLPTPKNVVSKNRRSIFALFGSVLVVVTLINVFNLVMGITTFNATFAKHVEKFGFPTAISSLFFIIPAATFVIVAPFFGYLADSRSAEAPLIITGLFIFGIGFLILGPSILFPFISFEVWTVCFGLSLLGLSFGCSSVPAMKCMVKGAMDLNFENSLDTFAVVSGLYNSINCLGGAVGPVAIGALVDTFGFSIAYTVVGLFSMFMSLVTLVYFSIRKARRTSRYSMDQNESVNMEKICERNQVGLRIEVGSTNKAFVLDSSVRKFDT